MDLVNRFLRYVRIDTQSAEDAGVTPSTSGQMEFVKMLRDELEAMGLEEITLDEHGYLFATLPANTTRTLPTIGFIAHVDTSPDVSGKNVNPRVVENYNGTDIVLSAEDHTVLTTEEFPELLRYVGNDLIVTDGRTLLGADDKAGIAEIVSAIAYLQAHPEIEHGKIRVGFNPDEEIGLGAHKFDVKQFGCDWAYTMDGGEIGELEYENFNAASARITIKGRNVHPGYAKDKMLNSMRVATELVGMLPKNEVPECTDGYEGFFHLVGMKGGVEETTLSYIIRDHSSTIFNKRKELLHTCVRELNKKYGDGIVTLELNDQYANMREVIEPVMYVIDIACQAMREVDVEPKIKPIRGGTDGAQLSFKGLPCPNIFAGGVNFHSRYEFVPVQSMQKAMMTIVKIAEIVGKG
ncbi:MAG: peptidase T [Bacteroidaceae bacterium]|nr:peptidase T [Bacteroidaceae bacterium]